MTKAPSVMEGAFFTINSVTSKMCLAAQSVMLHGGCGGRQPFPVKGAL